MANDVFSRVRKMVRPIRSYRGVWVSRQNYRLLLQLAARFAHIQREKFYSEFNSGIVSFVSLSIKKTVESRRNNSGKGNRTRCKLLLCFLSELLCLSFKLKLILKPAILLKFTHFQLCIENKQLRLLIVLGLSHILTVIYVLTNVLTKKRILRVRCHFAVSV